MIAGGGRFGGPGRLPALHNIMPLFASTRAGTHARRRAQQRHSTDSENGSHQGSLLQLLQYKEEYLRENAPVSSVSQQAGFQLLAEIARGLQNFRPSSSPLFTTIASDSRCVLVSPRISTVPLSVSMIVRLRFFASPASRVSLFGQGLHGAAHRGDSSASSFDSADTETLKAVAGGEHGERAHRDWVETAERFQVMRAEGAPPRQQNDD